MSKPCTWTQPGTCETLGTGFYCRGLEDGHEGRHQEEVLSPSNIHADVLRAFVEQMAAGDSPHECCARAESAAKRALRDAEAAARAVREGREPW